MGKGRWSAPIRVLFASPGVRDLQSGESHPRGFGSLAPIEDTKCEVPPIPGKATRKRRRGAVCACAAAAPDGETAPWAASRWQPLLRPGPLEHWHLAARYP